MLDKINDVILNTSYGVSVVGDQTLFRVWSPSSKSLKLKLYKTATAVRCKIYDMEKDENGIWSLNLSEDHTGKFYTYLVDEHYEVVDPYVHSTCANSTKGAILRAEEISPEGFASHQIPEVIPKTQSILYEVHINDFSMGEDVPFNYKGKYLAFTEKGLVFKGQKIGIDHLVELGITHVHLLPVYDFITVNDFDEKSYNWGYDPYLFNSPEGSYSTAPDDPKSRILELKALIMSLHAHDIRVVLDVVYNHTYFGGASNFHRLMPYVFHRTDQHFFHNGSGCGNELATEHPFVGRFILDSLKFWLEVYKVDGFRFDLMALYDTDFVYEMEKELLQIKPDLLLYGEPWCGGPSGLPHDKQFLKGRQKQVALFNDDFRNAIKGSNDGMDTGFVGHGRYRKDDVYAGCLGSIHFSNEIIGFAKKCSDSINYVSSHDNLILMDKFSKAFPHASFEEKQNMNALALSIVLMAFGIPFLQAGTEMLRSKYGDHNSYRSGYLVNRLHWENKKKFRHVFDYIKTLIAFRKSQRVFTVTDPEVIKACVQVMPADPEVIHYIISSPFEGDFKKIHVIHNGGFHTKEVKVGKAKVCIDGALYYKEKIETNHGNVVLPKLSSAILTEE